MTMSNIILKLITPVKVDAVSYSELSLRELVVDEIIALESQGVGKTTTAQDRDYFALSCGVPPDVIGKLGSRDWDRLKRLHWQKLGNGASEPETAV